MDSKVRLWSRGVSVTLWTRGLSVLLVMLVTVHSASASADHHTLQAFSGSDALLRCKAPNGTDPENLALEWRRANTEKSYVFMFRDGRPYLVYQESRFKGRVELADPTRCSGDLSLRLRNVSGDDSGLYECHVFDQSHVTKRSAYNTKPITTVHLKVKEPITIRASPGKDVIFPAEEVDFSVTSVMWKREDDPERYVFLMGMNHPHHENPLYTGRTKLRSQIQPEVQTRNLSMILSRVKPSDSGRYHCRIIQSQRHFRRDLHQSEPYSVVLLQVESSGALRSQAGVGFVAAFLILVFLQIWE